MPSVTIYTWEWSNALNFIAFDFTSGIKSVYDFEMIPNIH